MADERKMSSISRSYSMFVSQAVHFRNGYILLAEKRKVKPDKKTGSGRSPSERPFSWQLHGLVRFPGSKWVPDSSHRVKEDHIDHPEEYGSTDLDSCNVKAWSVS